MELTPRTTLHLLNRDWEWRYNLRTIFEFDKLSKKTFFLLRLADLTSEDWVRLIFAGIAQCDSKLTWEKFVENASVPEVMVAVSQVMDLLLSTVTSKDKESEDEKQDPTQARTPSTG